MQPEELYDQIAHYLSGNLSEEERTSFEAKISADPKLAQEVAVHRDLKHVLADAEASSMHKLVNEVDAEFFSEKTQAKRPQLKFGAIQYVMAAMVAILLLIGGYWIFIYQAGSVTSEELYAMNYEVYPIPSSLRSDAADTLGVVEKRAIQAFNNKKYESAADDFEELIKLEPTNTALQFYLGLCRYEQMEFDSGIVIFDSLISSRNPFQRQSKWYLALGYLAQGDPDRAKSLLEELSSSKGKYRSEAEQILKSI